MTRKIHQFDNSIRVYDDQLMPAQRQRYKIRNVHEADEEDLFIQIISSLPENGCFVNIGAAIGYYAILAKKLSPQLCVHAVEPLQSFRACLNENILLNRLSEKDFIIHPCAVGATDGRVSFLEKGYESQLLVKRDNESVFHRVATNIKSHVQTVLGTLAV